MIKTLLALITGFLLGTIFGATVISKLMEGVLG